MPAPSPVAGEERAARQLSVQSLDSRGVAVPVEAERFEATLATDVISPDDSTRWRLTANGSVEHFRDGGAIWIIQRAGIDRAWTGGSTLTARVFWLIGEAGTVVRTTDGGESWERVTAPSQAALVAIDAQDANTATVSDATVISFRTADGGETWTQIAVPIR